MRSVARYDAGAGITTLTVSLGLKHLGYASDPSLSRFDGATYNANKPG